MGMGWPHPREPWEPTTVRVSAGERVTTVFAVGEFDLATAHLIADALARACELDVPVVVDLSGVRFADASTLGLVVQAHTRLAARGRELSVASPSAAVLRLMELTGLGWLVEGSQ
jgi:anti-anti-sigma factor